MLPFPDECFRGIPSETQLLEDGLVSSDVFMFLDSQAKPDGSLAQSINWNDDNNAEAFTLAQKRGDGSLQFGGGLAVIPRNELDRLLKLPLFKELLYERDPIPAQDGNPENPYHGNLLLMVGHSKHRRKTLAATLAGHVIRIIPQP